MTRWRQILSWDARGEGEFRVGDRVRMLNVARDCRTWGFRGEMFTIPVGGLGTVAGAGRGLVSANDPYLSVRWDLVPSRGVFYTHIENVELV